MICLADKPKIGGELELAQLSVLERPRAPHNLRVGDSPFIWTDVGRSALLLAAVAILQRGGNRRAWLPAFACASVAQPFLQAGFEVKYYVCSVGAIHQEVCFSAVESGDTLLFIHYFGHANEEMARATRDLRESGVWIIEDCVQASLAPQFGPFCDFAVTSYRKLIPVLDGALLISKEPLDLRQLPLQMQPPRESFISAKLIAKILRGENASAESFLALIDLSEASLEEMIIPRHRSWISTWIMDRLDLEDCIAKRRENWFLLSRLLADAPLQAHVEALFIGLADDVAPLGFPLRILQMRRDDLRDFLKSKNIYCPVHWQLNHLPPSPSLARTRALGAAY